MPRGAPSHRVSPGSRSCFRPQLTQASDTVRSDVAPASDWSRRNWCRAFAVTVGRFAFHMITSSKVRTRRAGPAPRFGGPGFAGCADRRVGRLLRITECTRARNRVAGRRRDGCRARRSSSRSPIRARPLCLLAADAGDGTERRESCRAPRHRASGPRRRGSRGEAGPTPAAPSRRRNTVRSTTESSRTATSHPRAPRARCSGGPCDRFGEPLEYSRGTSTRYRTAAVSTTIRQGHERRGSRDRGDHGASRAGAWLHPLSRSGRSQPRQRRDVMVRWQTEQASEHRGNLRLAGGAGSGHGAFHLGGISPSPAAPRARQREDDSRACPRMRALVRCGHGRVPRPHRCGSCCSIGPRAPEQQCGRDGATSRPGSHDPAPTRRAVRPGAPATTPKPRVAVPGSMPSTTSGPGVVRRRPPRDRPHRHRGS